MKCDIARLTPIERETLFRNWRATIPYTDVEIANALETLARLVENNKPNEARWRRVQAAYVLRGHLTKRILSDALSILVKKCGVCGGTALYRFGNIGRCRDHRDVMPDSFKEHILNIEKTTSFFEARDRMRDAHLKVKERLRKARLRKK